MTFRLAPGRSGPRRAAPGAVREQGSLFGRGPDEVAITVSQLVAQMNTVFRAALPDVWVRGEIGEFRIWSSGHAYFTLKDRSAVVNAVMWASEVSSVGFPVEAGMELLARGRPEVYSRSGKLSLVVQELLPLGYGRLQAAFERLRAKLAGDGLFEPARKRPLPALPRRIGVVTSPHGAAVRDVLKVLRERFPNAHVIVFPVSVQGRVAAPEIARAVEALSRHGAVDVAILARGGGSRDDLWAFNEEAVVRAVAACRVPTISAIGHETDVTLTDLVADVRAATPSQAAELVVARRDELLAEVDGSRRHLVTALRARLSEARLEWSGLSGTGGLAGFPGRLLMAGAEVESLSRRLAQAVRGLPSVYGHRLRAAEERLAGWPERVSLRTNGERVEAARRALVEELRQRLARAERSLAAVAGKLSALDPLAVLARGYSITYRESEAVPLRDAALAGPGEGIRVVLARGELSATVTRVSRPTGESLPFSRTGTRGKEEG